MSALGELDYLRFDVNYSSETKRTAALQIGTGRLQEGPTGNSSYIPAQVGLGKRTQEHRAS